MQAKIEEWRKSIESLDQKLRPIADRVVDINSPVWMKNLESRTDPLDAAGVKETALSLITELIENYLSLGSNEQSEVRAIFAKNKSYAWASSFSIGVSAPGWFRKRIILYAILDQGQDSRDAILELRSLCETAKKTGIEPAPTLREIAAHASAENKYGMGSTREMLLRAC